jgi:hypothetical protein
VKKLTKAELEQQVEYLNARLAVKECHIEQLDDAVKVHYAERQAAEAKRHAAEVKQTSLIHSLLRYSQRV